MHLADVDLEVVVEQVLPLLQAGQRELDGVVQPVQHRRVQVLRPVGRQHEHELGALGSRAVQQGVDGAPHLLAGGDLGVAALEEGVGLVDEDEDAPWAPLRPVKQ